MIFHHLKLIIIRNNFFKTNPENNNFNNYYKVNYYYKIILFHLDVWYFDFKLSNSFKTNYYFLVESFCIALRCNSTFSNLNKSNSLFI